MQPSTKIGAVYIMSDLFENGDGAWELIHQWQTFKNSLFLPNSILHSRSSKLIIRRNQISKIGVRSNLHYNFPINTSNVQIPLRCHDIQRARFPNPIPCSNCIQFHYLLLQSPIDEMVVKLQQTNSMSITGN